MNGKLYVTDEETLSVLRSIIPDAKKSNDYTAVFAIMHFGLQGGRIKEKTA
jgi:hypothetical protein